VRAPKKEPRLTEREAKGAPLATASGAGGVSAAAQAGIQLSWGISEKPRYSARGQVRESAGSLRPAPRQSQSR
jgi:hypothetical protein